MLLIKTVIAPDRWGGQGLFASAPIKKGTRVWTYTPQTVLFYSIEAFKALSIEERATIKDHVWSASLAGVRGLVYSLDDDRYTNHSFTPNLGSLPEAPERDPDHPNFGLDDQYALFDIAAGEELTMDYFSLVQGEVAALYLREVPEVMQFETSLEEAPEQFRKSA